MSELPTITIPDWLAVILLALIAAATITLIRHCWRRAGRAIDHAPTEHHEYESWAQIWDEREDKP